MRPAVLLPSAAAELQALDAASQRLILGALRELRLDRLTGKQLGGGGTYMFKLSVNQYVIVYVLFEDAECITITEVGLPGARDQFARLDEALDCLDGLDDSDPRTPVLARAITSLAADQPIIKQIRMSDLDAKRPDLAALRRLRPSD